LNGQLNVGAVPGGLRSVVGVPKKKETNTHVVSLVPDAGMDKGVHNPPAGGRLFVQEEIGATVLMGHMGQPNRGDEDCRRIKAGKGD